MICVCLKNKTINGNNFEKNKKFDYIYRDDLYIIRLRDEMYHGGYSNMKISISMKIFNKYFIDELTYNRKQKLKKII